MSAIPGIPLIKDGDDLPAIVLNCTSEAGIHFENGDVLVVTSKIVSKAEGHIVPLASVQPSEKAREITSNSGKDARVVDLSVIIVVYNQPESLRLILQSLLGQDFSGSYEIIVTDDGSSTELLHAFREKCGKSTIPAKYVW